MSITERIRRVQERCGQGQARAAIPLVELAFAEPVAPGLAAAHNSRLAAMVREFERMVNFAFVACFGVGLILSARFSSLL